MRSAVAVLVALNLVLAGCATGPGGTSGSSGGSGVDPKVAALGCGLAGGLIGSQIVGSGSTERILGGAAGALLGAGLCGWLASRSFDQVEPGQAECRSQGGTRHCVHNEPPPPADACVSRVRVQFAETGEDAWRCQTASGEYHYYPVA